jgi:hypothetical protein
MGKSKLKGIVSGLLGTFVSRNNDIDGYWGLGVLRKLAESNGLAQIEIDLLCEDEEAEAIESCKTRYRRWLQTTLAKNNLSQRSLRSARIRIHFAEGFSAYPDAIRDTRGLPYECLVEIRRDDGGTYVASKVGVCMPHDPSRESKSNRSVDY